MIAAGYVITQNGVQGEKSYWEVPRRFVPMLKNTVQASGLIVIAPLRDGNLGLASIVNTHLRPSDVPAHARVLGHISAVLSRINTVPPLSSLDFVTELADEQLEKNVVGLAKLHFKNL